MSKANIMFRQYIAETFDDSLSLCKRAELWDAFYAGWIAKEDSEVNADLLAALESVLSRGCMLRRVDEIETEYIVVPHPETMAEVRAAIKKAKGGWET